MERRIGIAGSGDRLLGSEASARLRKEELPIAITERPVQALVPAGVVFEATRISLKRKGKAGKRKGGEKGDKRREKPVHPPKKKNQ